MQNLDAQKSPLKHLSLHSNDTPASARAAFDEIRSTMRNMIRNSNGNVRMNLHIDSNRGTLLEFMRYGATTGGVHAYFNAQRNIFEIGGDIDSIPLATAKLLTECVAMANEKIHRVDDCRNEASARVTDALENFDTEEVNTDGTGLRPSMPKENQPQVIPETVAAF